MIIVCLLAFYYCSIMLFICLYFMILSQYLCAISGHVQPGGTLLSFIYKKLRLLCSYTCNNKNLKNRVILSKREIFKDFHGYISFICLFWLILMIYKNYVTQYDIAIRSRRTADRQEVSGLDCNSKIPAGAFYKCTAYGTNVLTYKS